MADEIIGYELPWKKVNEISDLPGPSVEEWVDASGKFCKQVWSDGYVEIFEIAK